jgi:Zn-dependent protease
MDVDPNIIRDGLITFILLIASLSIHEWAHAIVADLLGDDTPRMDGRVTLNPLVHLDPIGTVLIPLINIFAFGSSFSFIAWAKPVMVNTANFRRRRLDDVLVTLAGPGANVAIALVATVVGSLLVQSHPLLAELVHRLVVMNVGLAVFNMLPIPPMDGGIIFSHAVGMSQQAFATISRFSGIFILVAINVPACQMVLLELVGIACIPFEKLSLLISPDAFARIFPL